MSSFKGRPNLLDPRIFLQFDCRRPALFALLVATASCLSTASVAQTTTPPPPPAHTQTAPSPNGQRPASIPPANPPSAERNHTNPAPATGGAIVYPPRTYTPDPTNLGRPNEPARTAPAPVTNYTPLPRSNPAEAAPPTARPVPSSSNGYFNNRPVAPPNAVAPAAATRMQTRPVYNINGGAVAATTPEGASTLNSNGSRQVLSDVNATRARLGGFNSRPIPEGNVTVQPTGHLLVAAGGGRDYTLRPNGTIASFHGANGDAAFRANGAIASLRTPTLSISNTGHGERVIASRRPDNSIVVSVGRNSGYVQRPVVSGGVTYEQRTWVIGQDRRTALYLPYRYHGIGFYHYVPRYTYVPAFYGWAYYGWGRPYCYRWGWSSDPWYSYYGGFYAPSACYAGASAWLADYYLSQTLAYGYQQYDPSQAPGSDGYEAGGEDLYAQTDTPISPAIKDLLAQDVQQQIAMENAAANQPGQAYNLTDLPQVLQPNHLFVVSQPLNVITADQLACSLSAGNVLQLQATPPDGAPATALAVLSSRRGGCPAGVQVTVSLTDLEEMQNNFRAQMDTGLNMLYDQQGQNGLPAAPQSAIAPPPRPAPDVPANNENVQALLSQEQQQAAQAEQQVTQQAFPPPQP